MPYVFIFLGMLILALVQGRLGFLGIEYHLGAGWAWVAIVASLLFRSFLPITIGAYFGAVDVMRWDWYIGVAIAFPGLFFVMPSMVMTTLAAVRSDNSKNNGTSQTLTQTIDENPSTVTELNSVDQPPVPKPQSQAPGSATTEVPNSDPRDEIEDYPRGAIAIRYRAEIASDWSKVRLMPSEYKRMYLEKLDDNPDIDAQELYGIVDECLKRDAAPFSDEQTNKMYALLAQYGSEAQKRFKDVHAVLGASFNAEQVALEIEKDFSTEKFLDALEPHCYRTIGGVVFRKFANGGLKLLSINGIEQDVNQLSISDLLIQFDKFVNDFRSAVKVDFIEVRKAGNSTSTVTTDQNTYWLKSHAGEKSFGSIWEVYDYLGTPQSFRHKI